MKGYLDGPWGQIHFRRAGPPDAAPLVCLHQTSVSGAMFAPAFPHLVAAGLAPIAFDTPGYGASDAPPAPVRIADYADALAGAIEQVCKGPVHLVGHHTGAAIAANIAARRPELVERLVLNGVPLLSEAEREHFRGFKFGPIEPKPDGSHLLQAWNMRLQASPGWTDLAAMHRHVVDTLRVNDIFWYAFEAAFAHDMAPDLAAIDRPTLILTNTGDDIHEASLRAAALRPDFALVALKGGTHDIVDEQPETWAGAIVDFLTRKHP